MFTKAEPRRLVGVLVAVTVAASLAAGCSLEGSPTPALTGPSEYGLSITIAASPEQLPRDGSSQAVVTVTVRDEAGRPVAGRRLGVSANIGSVSESEIVTSGGGQASFAFVAPEASTGSNEAVLRIVPIDGNAQNAVGRTLSIALTGTAGVTSTTAPTASFTPSPSAPVLRETVSFDASATKDEGVLCLDLCTYSWNFGGEATGSGRIVTYRFLAVRAYAVTLTVTDAAGTVGTNTQTVTVDEGDPPTATITSSPSSPGQFETVNFSAEESRVGQVGRTIINYQWQFGDGSNATGLRVTHAYNVLGTYRVILTVTDNAGIQGTDLETVTVVNGVTADFDFSPDDPTTGQTVVFNAEKSKGSSTGFGTRNPITKYIWHFGKDEDTEETTSPITSTSFSTANKFRVTLTVVDDKGRRNTTVKEVTVD